MNVCVIVLLSSPFLSAFANGNPYSESYTPSNDVRFPTIDAKGRSWYWNSSPLSENPELAGKSKRVLTFDTGDDADFIKAAKAISGLEISKSIELVFDPRMEALIPAAESPNAGEKDHKMAQDSAVVLLSPKTYERLKAIFDNLESERGKGENVVRNFKNFQTGRFKSKYFKPKRAVRL